MEAPNDKNPLISVILPVYNGENFIAQAVNSVLSQEHEALELIVINDGSTDHTEQILKQFEGKITCINQENSGPSKARNAGVEAAKGEYIGFIDADDIWVPGNLDVHLKQFDNFNTLDISVGLTSKIEFESPEEIKLKSARQKAALHLVLGASLMKKSVFDQVGLFDEELILGQDTDWFLRAREKNKMIAVSRDLVLFYRKHPGNRTNDRVKAKFYLFKVLKKAKDRKTDSQLAATSIMKKPENQEELMDIWHTVQPK